jgi:hypothetical protein
MHLPIVLAYKYATDCKRTRCDRRICQPICLLVHITLYYMATVLLFKHRLKHSLVKF